MIGLVNVGTGELEQALESVETTDVAGYELVDLPDPWPSDDWAWDAAARACVPASLDIPVRFAHWKIDMKAGRVKLQLGSPGYAIDATYKAKEEEARRYMAEASNGGDPDSHIADYPYIAGGAGVDAATASEVATLYLAMAAEWHAFNAAVETVRITSKQQVSAATSRAGIDAVLAAIVWPSPAI